MMDSAFQPVQTKSLAVIEFVLKLLWGLSANEQQAPQVILDTRARPR
jgi:hypothetical protein